MSKSVSSPPAKSSADYNLRILWPLARYLEERGGGDDLRAVAATSGLEPRDFGGQNRWVAAATFERVLSEARSRMASDDEFMRACAYRIKQAYGPLRYVLWATTPGVVFAQAAKQYRLVSTCGDLKVEYGRTWARGRFVSHVPYSRLNCLLRQAQSAALPTLWGLPEAHIREHACVARGDLACEFDVRWYEARRWMPVLLGAAAFAVVGFALVRAGIASVPTPIAMALIGAALGYVFEVRRTERANDRTRQEVMDALRQLAHEESDARRELLLMHDRQKEWTRLVEEEMRSRLAELDRIVKTSIRGVTHDLRSPLQVLAGYLDMLGSRDSIANDVDALEMVGDLIRTSAQLRNMFEQLWALSDGQRLVPMRPQEVSTAGLADAIRRRLRALICGREIRTSVFPTREVPEWIKIDPIAVDRIVDNLISNAAKYTDRGSIVVEIEGTPGFLVIKVCDTGRGIAPEALERVFDPAGSDPDSRRGGGFGVGLSVVVQLLDQMGGRLEVMSKPNFGTTFWVYLPREAKVEPTHAGEPAQLPEPKTGPAKARVVRIRRQSA